MKIDVLARTYFEERIGSDKITQLLKTHKVISIQSSLGWDSEPPFSKEHRESKNLLCYEYFMARNPFIMPNPNVVEAFLRFLEP